MESPAYYKARIAAIEQLLTQIPADDKNISRVLLRNGVIPETMQKAANEFIQQNIGKYTDAPLTFTEICRYSTWFDMYPEKVAGTEYVTTSIMFPLMIKGSKDDILNTVTVLPQTNEPEPDEMQLEFEMLALELELLGPNLSGFSLDAVGRYFKSFIPNTKEKRIGECKPENCETLEGIKGHACCLLHGKCEFLKPGGCSIYGFRIWLLRNCRIFPRSSDDLKLIKNCGYSFINLDEEIIK